MGGLCRVKDVGQLVPAFGANQSFRLEVSPPDGILERLDFYVRGDHTTNITTPQDDGELNTFLDLRVTFPRRNLPPILWNVLPRDLKWITAFMEGQLAARANPTATTANHFGQFSIPLVLPPMHARNPNDWGLDTADLSGPIIIEGTYNGVASIGTGSTAITQDTNVSTCVRSRRRNRPPVVALSGNQNRIQNEVDGRNGPTTISTGNLEALWALFLRQFDSDAPAADKVDGLITRYTIEHSQEGILDDDFQIISKKRGGKFFQLANADLPAGINFSVFAQSGDLGDMPILSNGRTLKVLHDSVEAVPVEVTNVTPAAGDAFFAIPIGIQLTRAGVAAAS